MILRLEIILSIVYCLRRNIIFYEINAKLMEKKTRIKKTFDNVFCNRIFL